MNTLEYYQSLPSGTLLKFKTCEVIKMKDSPSYYIDEFCVLKVDDGTIHHISNFVIFSENSIWVLECASGKIRSDYAVHIMCGTQESEEALKLRAMLEFHFGSYHYEILNLDVLIRFEEFKRRNVKPVP
jgi:hypothetical protein